MRKITSKKNKKIYLGLLKQKTKYILSLSKNLIYSLNINKLKKTRYLLICHDANRPYKYRGLAYSPLINTVGKILQNKNKKIGYIATPFSVLTNKKSFGNPASINGYYLIFKIISFLCKKVNPKISLLILTNCWEKILKKIKPKAVIAIQPEEALCFAGKITNTKIIDLQHGIIDDNGYYRCRKKDSFQDFSTPDYVLCWDKNSMQRIQKNLPGVKVKKIGHVWIRRFQAKNKDFLVKQEEKKLEKIVLKQKNIILITTQWAKNRFTECNVPEKILSTIQDPKLKSINWFIKFHPIQLQRSSRFHLLNNFLSKLKNRHINIVDVSDFALPAILKYVKYHICYSSASAIEASFCNVKTGLWGNNRTVKNWFAPFKNNKLISYLPARSKHITLFLKTKLKLKPNNTIPKQHK